MGKVGLLNSQFNKEQKARREPARDISLLYWTFRGPIILVNNNKIGSFFRYKDSLPVASRSSVIYQFMCPRFGDQYVVFTSRMLSVSWPQTVIEQRVHNRFSAPPTGALLRCSRPCIHTRSRTPSFFSVVAAVHYNRFSAPPTGALLRCSRPCIHTRSRTPSFFSVVAAVH